MQFWGNCLARKTIEPVSVQCVQDVIISSLFSQMHCCLQFDVVLDLHTWCMDESFFRWCGGRGSDWPVRYRALCCTSLNLCSNAQKANEDYVTLTFSDEGEEKSEWDGKKKNGEKDEGIEQSGIKTGVKDREREVTLKNAALLYKTKNAVTGKGGGVRKENLHKL